VPNFAEPVSLVFIAVTVAAISALVGLGIFLVKRFKD